MIWIKYCKNWYDYKTVKCFRADISFLIYRDNIGSFLLLKYFIRGPPFFNLKEKCVIGKGS